MIYQWKIQLSNKQTIQVIFSQRKDTIIHRFMFLDGSEVAVKSEYKTLSTILDSELNFQSHIRQAVIKARRGTVLEPFPIYPITYHGGVLDQIYKIYVRPHLYYDDINYHKYDPELNLTLPKS